MPIQHLLYRCPRCGHDPTTATSRGARCESCGTTFEQGRGAVVFVRSLDGEVEETSACVLIDAIDKLGGPASRATDEAGAFSYEAEVAVTSGNRHQSVWWKGRVLGFFERISDRGDATLRLDGAEVIVTCAGQEPLVWHLGNIHAIQVSSRAIQLNIKDVGLYQMEFLSDSPKRWEDLIKAALTHFYSALGQEVVEFQPKIVTRVLA